ncbi:MAG: ion transporter, partial [Opitutae bacterium]|nr:ion transporter [Opitutae bacterium]
VGVQTYKEFANRHIEILTFLDSIVLAIFTLEAVIKILAEGKRPINYFRNAWNVFDFLIVTVCLMEPLLPLDAEFLPVLRLARILRVLRLVTVVPKLQLIVGTLLKSIPSMFYVCILLFLLFYMYGAMGVFLYGDNDPIHFRNLQTALLSLFRVTTLEDWTDVMYINMYGSDNYGYSPEDLARWTPVPTASPLGAAFFFVSFVLIGTMVVLNLVIGVIMNSMDEMNAEMALNERIKLRRELEDPIREGMEDFHERFLELNEEIQIIKKLIQKERKS